MLHLRFAVLLLFVSLQVALSPVRGGSPNKQVPVCVAGPESNTEGCPKVTHHFPRSNQITDYVQYRNYVPSMREGTVCAWIEPTSYDFKFIVGYASGTDPNELIIFFMENPTRVETRLKDISYHFLIPSLTSLPKYHFCFTFSSKLNQRSFYINGDELGTGSHSTPPLSGGGVLVLGQDHDQANGGNFHPSQSFRGSITNFMIWPRVLKGQEIRNIARYCDCPVDFAVAMTLDRVEHHGEAYYSIPDQCPIV